MNLFRNFFKKKKHSEVSLEFGTTITKYTLDTSQTSEKFKEFTQETVDFLIPTLIRFNDLEREICTRSESLKNPFQPNQVQPREDELWAEYTRRHNELVQEVMFEPELNRSLAFGIPTRYDYLYRPNLQLNITMKSEFRATLEFQYTHGIDRYEQFVLKKVQNQWKLASKKYRFSPEDSWRKDDI